MSRPVWPLSPNRCVIGPLTGQASGPPGIATLAGRLAATAAAGGAAATGAGAGATVAAVEAREVVVATARGVRVAVGAAPGRVLEATVEAAAGAGGRAPGGICNF